MATETDLPEPGVVSASDRFSAVDSVSGPDAQLSRRDQVDEEVSDEEDPATVSDSYDLSFDDDDEDFAELVDRNLAVLKVRDYAVVIGEVVAKENGRLLIDVGGKSEGWVDLSEFERAAIGEDHAEVVKVPDVGDSVEVFIERSQSRSGEVILSREKALREKVWIQLEDRFKNAERVEGVIQGRIKGGFTVLLEGLNAFLPGSQVDVRPVRDITPLLGSPQPFRILKMDRARGNVLVSRRAIVEEKRSEKRQALFKTLREGQIVEGVVKNLTDYGAFVDLGGADGLVHIADISWRRVNNPAEVLHVDQHVKVKVLRIGPDGNRIGLGLKQLEADPWESIEARYPVSTRVHGVVRNIAEYGVFVRLEDGIEGLVHVSEMSWSRRNVVPSKLVQVGQEVEVMVLSVDRGRKRIGLGMRQCLANPWEMIAEQFPKGAELEGEIRNITEFGLFVGVSEGIDGMVHVSDIEWDKSDDNLLTRYSKGDVVKVRVLGVDPARERISLGIKQLTERPMSELDKFKRGSIVTAVVSQGTDAGLQVTVGENDVPGFIRRSDIALDSVDARPDRYAQGEKVDAKIIRIDRDSGSLQLSIRARETDEEREAVEAYGSSDSGASLGDILGVALEKAREEKVGIEAKDKEADSGDSKDVGTSAPNSDDAAADSGSKGGDAETDSVLEAAKNVEQKSDQSDADTSSAKSSNDVSS